MDLFFIILGVLIGVLVLVIFIRTFTFGEVVPDFEQGQVFDPQPERVAERLSRAIQCQTISFSESQPPDAKVLKELRDVLEKNFPQVHKICEKQLINGDALLFTWKGKNTDLKPILFAGHQDVVPVDENDVAKWTHAPFSGEIVDGWVWGRGALDMKNQVVAVLESVERLIESGYQPERTIYLAFGHDEEIGGIRGAAKIVEWLKEQKISLEAVIDEGGMILSGLLDGVDDPFAMVGIAEKGMATIDMSLEMNPGHSSMPPHHTAIGVMSKAIIRLEDHPMPAEPEMMLPLMRALGKSLPFVLRMAFANMWLFKSVVISEMRKNPRGDASIRTTTAVTLINGGIKDNILPPSAKATVNFRVIPGECVADVLEHMRNVIKDERIQLIPNKEIIWDASPVSNTDSAAYMILKETIQKTFNNVPVACQIFPAATDSRHYYAVCQNVYRFMPLYMTSEALGGVHGINERVEIAALEQMVQFFGALIKAFDKDF
ncbi:MAG: M20 family peptidase [Anaerolineaceae bacterium]|nr:M20 family peptidase [Anaerolineaceae bacterium]